VIGKAYSGLTDVEIAEMTEWFEAHRLPPAEARAAYERLDLKRGEILVEPTVVVLSREAVEDDARGGRDRSTPSAE